MYMQELKLLRKEDWNELQHDDWETQVEAKDDDIVVQIGNVMFLVERTNDANNVISQSLDINTLSIKNVRAMFQLCIYLWDVCGIEYIRVEGNPKRYRFLERMFPREVVIKDDDYDTRNVYYCNLKKAREKLVELTNK